MPHLQTTIHEDIKLEKNINDVNFNFIAKHKLEDKICVSVENKTFFLTKQIKDNINLIKIDQATRVTPITIAKKALNAYASICSAEILFSNTANNENKLEPKKEYLKEIDYFVDEFKTNKEICIEVGFGSGRHLLYQAQQNPHIQYIGLEIHTPSIEQMLKQVKILGITNVYAINYDARLFLEFMNSNTISRVFVHFPVPWDKKPHRRVMSIEFINECLRALKIDGSLELRTDSPNYYEYSKELLESYKNNKHTIIKNQELAVSSKYEDRWKKQGKDIWDLTIYSNENSKDINLNKDFSFNINNEIDVYSLEERLNFKPMVKDDYFVHFDKVYISNENLALLSITMGSFTKPLSIFVIFENNSISYFQNKPIPTSSNYKAHLLIQNLLNELAI
jgi:tRNA (guanine-N7-)-methyltransferase